MPKTNDNPPVTLTEEQAMDFYNKSRKQVLARNRLNELNQESKALRTFMKENEQELIDIIVKNRLKSCRTEGSNLRIINKTIKVSPTVKDVYEAIEKMYHSPEMLNQVKGYVENNYVLPKQITKPVLKIVKSKKKKDQNPN